MNNNSILGAILGCAVGDALGIPYENLSPQRAKKLLGLPDRYRFLFRRGMVSDDTEHTCMVAQSYCEHPDNANDFANAFAKRLRWWLMSLPAGIGFATLRSIIKSWLGFPPQKSGVFSAGNGPAMRSAILGAIIDDQSKLKEYVTASTLLTHTDPKALDGALAVAFAAYCAKRNMTDIEQFCNDFHTFHPSASEEFLDYLEQVEVSIHSRQSTIDFAQSFGCTKGVSGYVYKTVPMALHAWLSHPNDFQLAVMSMIECGGDADTTAAIVGAIVGCGVGAEQIPGALKAGLAEWPRNISWMTRLSETVSQSPSSPPKVFFPAILLRNLFFFAVVLVHIVRRWLPPY